jgi:SpoVK/Ycf46/Vps4 family AAA+-type ATPase
MTNLLQLTESKHPNAGAAAVYDSLVGIDTLKQSLVDELILILDRNQLDAWLKRHHPHGLSVLNGASRKTPLILLSGEVGCGKTALASCVATPVAKEIDGRILTMETPSDIRGSGHVGELSLRITDAFSQASRKAAQIGRGILIIDEADDLATQRSQMQAHHEDRAGVNVLIKQIDQLAQDATPMAVILITNRAEVLDPAVVRRAALSLRFERPREGARREVFRRLLHGTKFTEEELTELVALSEREIPYTFSDLTNRIGRVALRRAWKANKAYGATVLLEVIATVEPSPLFELRPRNQ